MVSRSEEGVLIADLLDGAKAQSARADWKCVSARRPLASLKHIVRKGNMRREYIGLQTLTNGSPDRPLVATKLPAYRALKQVVFRWLGTGIGR